MFAILWLLLILTYFAPAGPEGDVVTLLNWGQAQPALHVNVTTHKTPTKVSSMLSGPLSFQQHSFGISFVVNITDADFVLLTHQ